jgi:hypothetical protein
MSSCKNTYALLQSFKFTTIVILDGAISSDGNIVVEIKQRIEKANAAYNKLQNI